LPSLSALIMFLNVLAIERTSWLTNAHSETYSCDLVFPIIYPVLLADLMMLCSRASSFSFYHEIAVQERCLQFMHWVLRVL
jgi:hypothetical protein